MVIVYVDKPEKQLYKCMTFVWDDKIIYIKINFGEPFDSADKIRIICPREEKKESNMASPLTYLFPRRIFIVIKRLLLKETLQMNLGFVKLNGVYCLQH